MKKTEKKPIVFIVMIGLMLILGITFCIFHTHKKQEKKGQQNALFSWERDVMEEENRKELFDTMDKLGLHILYQNIPKYSEEEREMVLSFLQEAKKRNIAVYALLGEPSYGLEADGAHMKKKLTQIQQWKEISKEEDLIAGVLMDVEPYVTEEWKMDEVDTMTTYVSAMKSAYEMAREEHLTFGVCIPFYYEENGKGELLEELIKNGCDFIAIMNYLKRDEIGQISTEMSLCGRYNKTAVIIYEMQKPGVYDLREINTYYHEGIGAVKESAKKVEKAYPDSFFGYAFHEYNATREVLAGE